MRSILIKNADYLVTSNDRGQILRRASLLIEDNLIASINPKNKLADKVINARGKVVLPGLINTHHHLFQAFMRHHDELQNQKIDKWIGKVAFLAKKMNPEAHYYAALVNLAELLLSGCTTTTDMLYLFPKKYSHEELFSAGIRAAQNLGIRFHPYRGSMSLSQKDGALFPDDTVETSEEIIERTTAMIEKYHNEGRSGMVKVGIAPCTVFTNTAQDYLNATETAKKYNVNLQTHVSESEYEQEYILQKFKTTPLEYIQSLGWNDLRVSWVHGIELNKQDLKLIQKHKQSICHCPISNARSAVDQKGVAPVWEMLKAGVNICLGVDGSAGNDSSNILEEMRWARTLQGVRSEATYLKPMEVFYMATMGGAKALRWDDMLGSLEPGKCADIAIFDINDSVGHVGAWDKVGSLISCQAKRADTVIINGKIIVKDGQLLSQDESRLIKKAWKVWNKIYGA